MMKWHGDEVMKRIEDEMAGRLTRAALLVTGYAKEHLSKLGPSAPGAYPGKRTGHLRRNIAFEVNKSDMLARWGTNVKYGRYLEEGTTHMDPRPWMAPTNSAMASKIRSVLGGEI